MPFILIFFIRKYHLLIKSKDARIESINTLFANLSTITPGALYYIVIFMLRRLLFAFNAIFLESLPIIQVQVLFGTSLAAIVYLIRFKPFDLPLLNRLEIFNELCLYLMSYPCLLFTDIQINEMASSSHFKYSMGWVVVGGVLLNISINMLIMLSI
jgi:hypothetical protein